jgi:hypothetical protein
MDAVFVGEKFIPDQFGEIPHGCTNEGKNDRVQNHRKIGHAQDREWDTDNVETGGKDSTG